VATPEDCASARMGESVYRFAWREMPGGIRRAWRIEKARLAWRYQSLRHFDDVPRLPSGYFGMFVLAWLPPLWFRLMDRRLLDLPHIDGDLGRVNLG
jgi:hypothetical protein